MNRIREKFESLSALGKRALIPFIMAGDPSLEYTRKLIPVLEKNGADIIEIGVPFSDPLADGPIIQEAAQIGLDNGFKISSLFDLITEAGREVTVPLVFLIYYNLILQYGVERFMLDSSKAGIDGLVIPDLPPEEAESLIHAASNHKIAVDLLVAPTTSPERIKMIAKNNTGFIYLVSVRGVTGERTSFTSELPALIKKVKKLTAQPVAVGFGISGPEQAKEVATMADGVIVGSAIVKRMRTRTANEPYEAVAERVGQFVGELREAIDFRSDPG